MKEMKIFEHEKHPGIRFVLYEEYDELAGKYLQTQRALKEIFELLEEHQPEWYLQKHYKRVKKILEIAD
jgi:hypothetical protein